MRSLAPVQARPPGLTYDWSLALLLAWSMLGLYADGWSHNHHGDDLDTFFTPSHALLYAGMVAGTALVVVVTLRGRAGGLAWRAALPDRGATLLGQSLFFLGGLGDLVWHVLFGVESNVEALLSPTHLLLATAGGIVVTGPLRAAWRRPDPPSTWRRGGPVVLSLTYLLALATFFLQFAHPIERPAAALGNRPTAVSLPVVAPDPPLLLAQGGLDAARLLQSFGVAATLLQAIVLTGIVLVAVRRWGPSLPPGAMTFLLGVDALAMAAMRDQLRLVPAFLVAGLLADLVLQTLRPCPCHPIRFRLFASALPALWTAALFAGAAPLWWSTHLWTGTIVLAGLAGYLMSHAYVAAELPAE